MDRCSPSRRPPTGLTSKDQAGKDSLTPTARHAGHADIIRELIDGRIGDDGSVAADPTFWSDQTSRVQSAADYFAG
ncbi:DUF664 domain-containing protein [Actinopolymorpha alba]|uniref:mycothiol transferase n=1 Tax=Actinopolymorpha alba TaxID=533267 RepID=UPI0003A6EA61